MTAPNDPAWISGQQSTHYSWSTSDKLRSPTNTPYLQVRVGEYWYCAAVSTTNQVESLNTLSLGWMPLPPGTYDTAVFTVGVAGTTGAVTRVVVYNDDGTGLAGTLLAFSGQVDTTTTGLKTIAIALTVPSTSRGVWAGTVPQVSVTTQAQIGMVNGTGQPITWDIAGTNPTIPTPRILSSVSGNPPASGTAGILQGGRFTRLGFRRSA